MDALIVTGNYKIEYLDRQCSYETLQAELGSFNEKNELRKKRGIYYTPNDIVEFIISNSVKLFYDKIKIPNLNKNFSEDIPDNNFCYECTFFDPTCGSGVFLLPILEMKLNCLENFATKIDSDKICKIVSTLYGNDLNHDSILIVKLRLFLSVLNRYGAEFVSNLGKVINDNFSGYDFIEFGEFHNQKFDIIIGNPPYVEDKKSSAIYKKKYGNIYANVLSVASKLLKKNGVMGFIIPLSYISTPRMKKIREELFEILPLQYILSFADRPCSLFLSVHQKLCILFGKSANSDLSIFTGNYTYWHSNERKDLFENLSVVANNFYCAEFIPKIGTKIDIEIYKKIFSKQISLSELFLSEGAPFYLNMRATFWIKAFLKCHFSSEYKIFRCADENYAALSVLLLNSSLFWWYWVCVSDCWHITKKELSGFKLPKTFDLERAKILVTNLENSLEQNKIYVGTKQTDYEYKHKFCLKEISEIDEYVNFLYELNFEESYYIKNFSNSYRIGGGG